MKKSFMFFQSALVRVIVLCIVVCFVVLFISLSEVRIAFATFGQPEPAPVDSVPVPADEIELVGGSFISIAGTTGTSPVGIVVDPTGNVFTANIGSNNVSKITPTGMSSIFATVGIAPAEIIRDNLGNLYTANSGSNTVTKITPAGIATTLGTTGIQPVALAQDANNNIYTANKGSNSVTKITPLGVSTTLGSTGNEPSEIVIDSAGTVFTLNRQSHTITRITQSGVSTVYANVTPRSVQGLAIDSTDHLYVTDEGNGQVLKFTSFTNFIGNVVGSWTWIGNTGNSPSPIIVAPDESLYIGNLGDSSITKMSQSGNSIVYGYLDPFPDDMTLDSAGNLYVVNSDFDTVTKIAP